MLRESSGGEKTVELFLARLCAKKTPFLPNSFLYVGIHMRADTTHKKFLIRRNANMSLHFL